MFQLQHNVTVIGTFKTLEEAQAAAENHELHDGHSIAWGREHKVIKTVGKGQDADGKEVDVVVSAVMTKDLDEDTWVGGWWRIDKTA